MNRMLNLIFVSVLSLCTYLFAQAQTAGTTVFVANDGGVDNATMDRAYKSVTEALKVRDGFTPVSTPAQASVMISLRCEDKSTVNQGNTIYDHIVRLSVIDPASHQSIWSAEEQGPTPVFQLNSNNLNWGKNFTKVANKLADDLRHAQASGQLNISPHHTS